MDGESFVILSAAIVIAGMIGWMISSLGELHRKVNNLLTEMREFRQGKR